MKQLSKDLRDKVIELFKSGVRNVDISERLKMYKGTVSKIIRKYQEYGSTATRPRRGRPKKTNRVLDRYIKRLSHDNPRMPATHIFKQIVEEGAENLSVRTVQRRLVDAGLFGRRPVKKPLISKKNRTARLEFAKAHVNWTEQQWNTILWSDESKFNLFGSDGTCYVRRPVRKRLDKKYQWPTVKHGGGNIMVWGCFSSSGTGPIVKIEGKMDKKVYKNILSEHMLPFAEEEMPLRWTFQQDNDPKHSSKFIKDWLKLKNVNVLTWPSQSPDLNPIEHLWEHVKRQLATTRFKNKNDLFDSIKNIWQNIPSDVCKKLVHSMNNRCEAVLDAKGYGTKY